jgi:RNA-directed DNA polymerase
MSTAELAELTAATPGVRPPGQFSHVLQSGADTGCGVSGISTSAARPEARKFLGFSISNDGSARRIAPKALCKFQTRVRDMTRRTRGISLPQLIEELRPYLLGWRSYFGLPDPTCAHQPGSVDSPKIALVSWRQWQNGHNRFNELRRRGVSKFHAAVAAGSPTGFWRMSGHPAVQQALRNHYFDSLGLPRLHVPDQA